MSISIQDAKDIIAEVKNRDALSGKDISRWWMYENHIITAARIAKIIASKIKGMNDEQAYVNALLHDVCRTNERQENRFHGISGYEKLISKDEKAARASLLHMFLWNRIQPFRKCEQMFFGNKKDYDFVADYIKNTQVTDDDLLVQLVDNLANKNGFVTIEQRAKDLSERKGVVLDQEWFETRHRLKTYFDKKIGCDIYNLVDFCNITNNPSNETGYAHMCKNLLEF